MNFNDRLTLGTIDLPDYATNGAIGPSSLVSNYSSININDFTDGLNVVLALRPRTYEYNGKGDEFHREPGTHISFVAQEAADVASYFVRVGNGEVDGEQVDDFLRYEGHALPFVLVNAIKELYNEVQRLTARLVQLEA